MTYSFHIAQHFKKQLKPYLKKYRHLLDDLINVLKNFDRRQASSLGANTYKIRIPSSDLPKGKSHAFRTIVLLIEEDHLITPLVIYFKGDRDNISRKEIRYHAEIIRKELNNEMP